MGKSHRGKSFVVMASTQKKSIHVQVVSDLW